MAARACLLAALSCLIAPAYSRECIEITLANEKFNDTILNRTLFAVEDNHVDSVHNLFTLWDKFPKVIVPTNGSTEQCRRDSRTFLNSLDKFELWALKMFDATAKPPSGILSGNVNQYGDFDECLSVDGAVRGKYCMASLQITLSGSTTMDQIDYMVHSGHYIRSNITDMGHRVPRFSSILWGVCIPDSCTSYDLEDELGHRLSEFGITVKVENTMCSTKNDRKPYTFAKALAMTFFFAIFLLLSMGTMLDDGGEPETNFERLLNAFSLKKNVKKLLDLNDSSSRIKGTDCIRGLNAFALLIAHKSMAIAHNAYVNKVKLAEVFGMHWAVVGRSAILYTDSFLYLSGFLNAHNLLQELERKGTVDVKGRLISRWFRLFPLFGCVMLFCTYILPDVNNGPQWNLVVEEHSRVCQNHMWRSFLFIHNFFGFEDMCLTHTHQIGMDFQLYVATLPLMILLWKSRNLGLSVMFSIAAVSTILRYLSIYWYDISMVVYYGISVRKLMDAARFCYILPTHRATIYLIGVAMAYFMKYNKLNIKLSENARLALWLSTFGLAAFTVAIPYKMGLVGYEYEHGLSADFAAYSPILWGLFMSIAHWAICNGYAGIGSSFVDSRFFKFFNKISYGVYLTQFPIFFYNVGVQRNSEYYSPFLLFYLPEMLVIIVISILTTVTIEMPFNEVYRIYFGKSQKKIKET